MHVVSASRGRIVSVLALLFLVGGGASPPPASATPVSYTAIEPAWAFGWLDQYSLDNSTHPFVGNEACVPTSTTNAMTYLQNVAPGVFGTTLTGSSYADWVATDGVLISPGYMDTTPSQGTYTGPQFYGTSKYISETKGFTQVVFGGQVPSDFWGTGIYAKPTWATDGFPTWNFIFSALSAGKATIFTIEYANGGGHGLLAQAFEWTDANGDGIIQKAEDAVLSFVDPLDPASYTAGLPSSGPKITSARVWNDNDVAGGNLKFDYLQYQGSLPYTIGSYGNVFNAKIDSVLTIAVPEPSTPASIATLVVIVLGASRARSARRARPWRHGTPSI